MQITVELDTQYIEKLHVLEQRLEKNTAELITLAIDKLLDKQTEGEKAYQLMQQSGFIACVETDENLSENYKSILDWSHKI